VDPKVFCLNCKFYKKIYYARNSLWYHEKKCNSKSSGFVLNNNNDNINEIKHVTNLVIEIIKNNSELQKNIFAIYKQLQSVTIDKK
jgi:N-acetyl-anhydromuramyl-L-alanine amidase AmpD